MDRVGMVIFRSRCGLTRSCAARQISLAHQRSWSAVCCWGIAGIASTLGYTKAIPTKEIPTKARPNPTTIPNHLCHRGSDPNKRQLMTMSHTPKAPCGSM
jgi:hypothetical protein